MVLVATGLTLGLTAGIGFSVAGDVLSSNLGALVLLTCGVVGAIAGLLAERERRGASSWKSFEREFWEFVESRADVNRTGPGAS